MSAFNANGTAFATTLANTGLGDAFIVKYNTSGSVQWVAKIASTAGDTGYGISTDSSGNVYVTGGGGGATVSAFNSDGTTFATTIPNAGQGDAYIVKYNTSGFVQWVARVASSGSDIGLAIATDSSGNAYVTGRGGSGLNLTTYNSDGTSFSPSLANLGVSDIFVVKYNTSGVVQWAARIATTGSDIGYGIVTDSSGSVYITGQGGVSSIMTYSAAGLAVGPTMSSLSTADPFIVKYDTSGNVQWVSLLAGTGTTDEGRGIALDSSNNIYAVGQFASSAFISSDA